MSSTQTPTTVNAAYAKWQKAIVKAANPLVTPTTGKRYMRDAEKAKLVYMALKVSRP